MIKMLRDWAQRKLPVLRAAHLGTPEEERERTIVAMEMQKRHLASRVSVLESQVLPPEIYGHRSEE